MPRLFGASGTIHDYFQDWVKLGIFEGTSLGGLSIMGITQPINIPVEVQARSGSAADWGKFMKQLFLCLACSIYTVSETFGVENEGNIKTSVGGLQGPGFSLGLKVGTGPLLSSSKNDKGYYYGARSSHLIAVETQYRTEKDWTYGLGVETIGIHGDTESTLLLCTPKVSRTLPWQVGAETKWSLGFELGAGVANQFEGSKRLAKGDAYRMKASLDWEILGDIPIFFLPGPVLKIDTDNSFGYKLALSVSHTNIHSTRTYEPSGQLSTADQKATELMLEFGIFYNHDKKE